MSRGKTALYRLRLHIGKIQGWAAQGREEFDTNVAIQDAILLNLEQIGECVKNLPPEWQSEHPAIPWRNIVGMRNFISHQYEDIKLEVIWTAVTNELEPLSQAVEQLAAKYLR